MVFFRRRALLNDDLLPQHASALVEQIKAMKNEILGTPRTVGTTTVLVPPLYDFDPSAGPVSIG
jgi:hypothetical protein